jgi:hypothetical protein
MQTRLKIVAATALVLSGCARFEHQTSLSEPHGVLRFGVVSEPSASVKSFDGLSLSAGREYRVKPGKHELVYQISESSVKIEKPVDLGIATLPPTAEVRFRSRYVTNVVLIEADWLYDVEGVEVKKTMFQGR